MPDSAQTTADTLGAGPPSAALTGSYGPAMVRSTVKQIEQSAAEKEAKTAPIYDQMQRDYQRDRSQFDAVAKDYKPIEQTKPPPVPENDPLKGFASAAALFAGLASAFTHTPAINAMNGMAAAINATKANDWEAYKAGYKQWKDNTELAIQNHKLQAEDMRTAMDLMQHDLSAGVAMAKAVAAQSDDKIATKLLEQGEYEKLAEHQRASGLAAASMQEHALRVQEMHLELQGKLEQRKLETDLAAARQSGDPAKVEAATQAIRDHLTATNPSYAAAQAGGTPGSPQYVTTQIFQQIKREHPEISDADAWAQAMERQKTAANAGKPLSSAGAKEADARVLADAKFEELHGRKPAQADEPEMAKLRQTTRTDAAGVITDEAADFVADRVLAGDERATVGMARSTGNITKVTNAVIKRAKEQNVTGNDLAIRIAEFQGTVSGERTLGTRAANMETAANVVKAMAPVALEASAKVDRTQFPTLNSVILAADRGTGGEDVVRFGQAANAIIYEYSKFLNPTGIPTDADKARATEILNTAWSSGQFNAALDQIVNKEIPAGAAGIAATRQEFREGLGTRRPGEGAPAAQFIEGKTYVDKSGNRAIYRNGKFEDLP